MALMLGEFPRKITQDVFCFSSTACVIALNADYNMIIVNTRLSIS